jgi:hypothetical protein
METCVRYLEVALIFDQTPNMLRVLTNIQGDSKMAFDVDNVFQYHKPFGLQPAKYEIIRTYAKDLAKVIDTHCPESREKSLALTNLQQAVMWANASIAINEKEPIQDEVTIDESDPNNK